MVKNRYETLIRNQKVDAAGFLDALPLVRAVGLVVLAHDAAGQGIESQNDN